MQSEKSANAQPFSEHVKELRRRLIYVISALFLGCVAGFTMHQPLFSIIRQPLHEQLYYTTPTGGFNAIIKISILFGALVTIPVLVYQIGKFLSPAFRRRIRATPLILLSIILAFMGVLFAYYVSLPAALHFLANIDDKNLQSLITVNEYLNFVTSYVVGFALLFQLPLIMLFINRIKPQRPSGLMRIQRYVVLVSFVLAALLTPTPDPMNQVIMALPIILLYQFSVGLIWYVNRRERKKNIAVEPIPVAPVVPPLTSVSPSIQPVATAPAAYGAATYSASSIPVQPTAAPATISPDPQAPLVTPQTDRPQPIMDIFWIPQTPTT